MSEIQILLRFKDGLITFLDELIEQFPNEGDMVIARIFLKDQVPIVDVLNHFIHHILPLKPLVVVRDENFFLENTVLFEELNKGSVNHFKRLWRSDCLDQHNRDMIWKWFESFMYLAERYQAAKSTQLM